MEKRVLKVRLLSRNAADEIVQKHVRKWSVVTDDEAETTEIIKTDTVEIEGVTWRRDIGVFQTQIVIGGIDKNNTFHRDMNYETALISWSRDQFPDFWQANGIDDLNGIDFDQVKEWLQFGDAVGTAGRNIWRLPEAASQLLDGNNEIVSDYRIKPVRNRVG
jgi:hypothetical protein